MNPLILQNPTTLGFLSSITSTWAAAFPWIIAIVCVICLIIMAAVPGWVKQAKEIDDLFESLAKTNFDATSVDAESFVAEKDPCGQRNDITTKGGGVTSRRPLHSNVS